jgi:hypothetical protein
MTITHHAGYAIFGTQAVMESHDLQCLAPMPCALIPDGIMHIMLVQLQGIK